MTTFMEQIKSVRVGVELDIFMQDGTFLEVQDDQEFFELGLAPRQYWRVYLGRSAKQAYELDDRSKYVIAHLPGGANPENRILEHHSYDYLSKEEVLEFVEANLDDYMASYLLIFEQDDYIRPIDYLENYSTELVTYGWALLPDADPEDEDWYKIENTDCVFTVPTVWLAHYLSDHPSFKEYVKGYQILEPWFFEYTHDDGYSLYKAAIKDRMLLNAQLH